MNETALRNLRTAERFLLAPAVGADFAGTAVAICDISAKGARFRHGRELHAGMKAMLQIPLDGSPAPVQIEAIVVWTQPDSVAGFFVSGVRTYAPESVMERLLGRLRASARTSRIEELRSSDRFLISPALLGNFGEHPVQIEDLSVRGARIETRDELFSGESKLLSFLLDGSLEVRVAGQVVWSTVKAVGSERSWRAGVLIAEKPELLRLAIGHLSQQQRATLDTQSLRLKLKIIRARARQLAAHSGVSEAAGVPAEQYLLIQGVREELRLNPEEAMHWYGKARLMINDPQIRATASPIADHPDALAVWEYLDRSVDPTVVGRAFSLRDR